MFNVFLAWCQENSAFIESIDDVCKRLNRNASVLCIGKYSTLGALMLKDSVGCKVDIYLEDDELDQNIFKSSGINVISSLQGEYTFIFAPLIINIIEKKDVVPLLFDIEEMMKKKSELILIFLASKTIDTRALTMMKSFYNENEELALKLYTHSDVINTLSTLGFKFSKIDKLEVSSPYDMICVDCLKNE